MSDDTVGSGNDNGADEPDGGGGDVGGGAAGRTDSGEDVTELIYRVPDRPFPWRVRAARELHPQSTGANVQPSVGDVGRRGRAPAGVRAVAPPVERIDIVELEAPRPTQVRPSFSEAHFKAAIKRATINVGGDLEITLQIPPAEKYNAITLTDASGIMVMFHARRLRRSSSYDEPDRPDRADLFPVSPINPDNPDTDAAEDLHDQGP